MITFLLKKFRFWRMQRESAGEEPQSSGVRTKFSAALDENLDLLRGIIGSSTDIVMRRFTIRAKKPVEAVILYLDGMIDNSLIDENVLKPLMQNSCFNNAKEPETITASYIKSDLLLVGSIDIVPSPNEAIDHFLSGDTVLLVDGSREALSISLRAWDKRNVEEPKTETVVRGPREGFTETMRTNTSMLRRKIKNPDFTMETIKIGSRTKTDVCIVYIRGLADPKLIEEIRRRLGRIKTDAILDSGYVEQFIEDAPYSIFATVANSEKPDKIAAKILEGRAAILVDGSPFVLTVPALFIESFQAAEDYYSRYYFASIDRVIRFIAFGFSVILPAMYVALTTFHQELIPTPLLLTMAAAHEGVPFPAAIESSIMVLAFGILREAGVRLPRSVGQAVSIVGALVIGESAVSAGLVGAPMVIVIALTAISCFIVPSQMDSGCVLRWLFLFLAAFMGGYGIAIGMFAVFIHLAKLRSFGTPFLSSVAPFQKNDMKDTFIRKPLWSMGKRPQNLGEQDVTRQANNLKPAPPQEGKSGAQS